MEQTLAELRQEPSKMNKDELNAVCNYLGTLREFYKRNKREDILLEDELKKFEDKYPLSRIALNSGQKRREDVPNAKNGKPASNAGAMIYVNGVHTKFSNAPPEYDPRGSYLDKRSKWSVRLKTGRTLMARGRQGQWQGWTNDGLRLSCEYVGKSAPSPEDISKRAARAANRLNNRYEAVCFVGDTKGKLAEFAENYSHPNLCIFFHSLEDGSLSYNKNNPDVEIFSAYFNGGQPKNIRDILKPLENAEGEISEADLQSRLRLGLGEIDKLANSVLFCAGLGTYALEKNMGVNYG
jgi:hypothetical protein